MAEATSAHRLLCEFRRHLGQTPFNGRIRPMECSALAKHMGLSDEIRSEAITQLLERKLIKYNPQTTEIIALTADGLALADQLILQLVGARVDDPLPDDLNEIRVQLSYWQKRQFEGEPQSIWWYQVQARIDALRHMEGRLTGPSNVTINATLTGSNARVNMNSSDHSTNFVVPDDVNQDD
jgi:hypothetical protein